MITITWINAHQKAAGMGALATRVGGHYTREWGEDVGEAGEESIRSTIDMGGINPTQKGGPRVLSGSMRSSAEHRNAYGAGTAFVRAGFGVTTSTPTHTLFQEGGTKRGITPMLAIPTAALAMDDAADVSGRKMMTAIAADWNTI